MSQLQAILKYQEIDRKLFLLEKELRESDERKEYVKYKKFLEKAEEKLDALDAKAAALRSEAVELSKKYLATEETLKEFDHMDELVEDGGADIAFYKKKALALSDKLKKIRAELNALETSVKETSDEYQALKKQVISAQKKYAEANEKYKALKAARQDEFSAIEAELAQTAKGISEEVLVKYQTKRKEKIFPIIGKLNGSNCPFCSMELPIVAISKLSGGSTIDCDSCHRVIYNE
jgi:predicted  nucleic acid-binding Zn-ribbon protein